MRHSLLVSGCLALLAAPPATAYYIPDAHLPAYADYAAVAGRDVQAGRDALVTGDVHGNNRAAVKRGATVTGDVSAGTTIKADGTVTGTLTPNAPLLEMPVLPTEAEARALANRVFDRNQTFTDLVLDDTVFVAGNVKLYGTLRGTGTLIASGKIKLEGPELPATPDPTSSLALVSFKHVQVGRNAAFRGALVAGGNLKLKGPNRVEGPLVALGNIKLGAGVDSRNASAPDTGAPTIAFTAPAQAGFSNDPTPTVTATLGDAGSGVDSASVRVYLDGVDRTAEAQVTASSVSLTPSAPLSSQYHGLQVSVSDLAGNQASSLLAFGVDTDAPTVAVTSPAGTVVAASGETSIKLAYGDVSSVLDTATLDLRIDGNPVSCTARPDIATCPLTLAAGEHAVAASIKDVAGNSGSATGSFTLVIDTEDPVVAITSPAEGAVTGSMQASVSGTASDDGGLASLEVGGTSVPPEGGSFSAPVDLEEGSNSIRVVATDHAGRVAAATVRIVRDTTGPVLTLTAPEPGVTSNRPSIRVSGRAEDTGGVATVTVNGVPVTLTGSQFSLDVALATTGSTPIHVVATDVAGNSSSADTSAAYYTIPEVTISSPVDLSFLATTTVRVEGTLSDTGATVDVNGVEGVVTGTTFSADDVPLVEGGNLLTAVATNANGHTSSATITVVRDRTPPRLSVDSPAAGSTIYDASVVVSGLVNDIVAGTVNSGEATVTVNGVNAQVANRAFQATVPLALGSNTLTVIATDVSGNSASIDATVERAEADVPHLAIAGGDSQSAAIGTKLAAPLVAVALDAAGAPVAGVPVLFRLVASNGSLDDGQRQKIVTTDANGQAAVEFTLGTRAGTGNQRVEASAVAYAGPVTFHANALTGAPAHLFADSGSQQYGIAGHALPRPLVGVVTDAGYNRLAGVPVRFSLKRGEGSFPGGATTQLVSTDSDGRAITNLILDPEEGTPSTVAEARIEGLTTSEAIGFVGTGYAAADPAGTTISGVVLDNSNEPIEGVTMRIRDYPQLAQTDENGAFRIEGAPVGSLYLIADGSTANRPGTWPDLEFVVTTIPGRDITVGMPIFLLPLDVGDGVMVTESQGATLTIPEIPGFKLEIEAGSVTFLNGTKNGTVSATLVHSDKVPMVPNFGQQPRMIVTIQPAGARFEPPARMTLPNLEGLAPGAVTEFYSFDHDLGHFVSIGPATVSDDGQLVTSNPGVGLVKAGWHCGGDPNSSGATHNCGACQKCEGNTCVPDNPFLPNPPDSCIFLFCSEGKVESTNWDHPLPQNSPTDCKKEVCRNQSKVSEDDFSEPQQQIDGNCQREVCGEPGWRPDLSDSDPGSDCCPSKDGGPPREFSTEAQCCGADGTIQLKHPVFDLEACDQRKQKPGYETDFNGCSVPEWGALAVATDRNNPAEGDDTNFSNYGTLLPFTAPCDIHDVCFQTCSPNSEEDFPRAQRCTIDWCGEMFDVCYASQEDFLTVAKCFNYATLYCDVVMVVGFKVAFQPNQKVVCNCC